MVAAGATIFADPTITFIHTRNAYARCFMFSISRADAVPVSPA
jgi:hypothetical protein